MQNNESKECSKTLRKCPICGGEKLKIESKTKDIPYRHVRQHTLSVRCNKCHARGGTVSGEIGNYSFGTPVSEKHTTLKELEEKAIEAWNNRKPMERIVERLEVRKGTVVIDGKVMYQEDYFIDIDEAIEIVKEEGGLNE